MRFTIVVYRWPPGKFENISKSKSVLTCRILPRHAPPGSPMTSIVTNSSAIAALATLRTINDGLATTQSHVSSGYRIGKAADNAAYWSIATTMRSDDKALSAVQDAMGMGAAKVDVAYTGMQSAIDVVTEIKAKLVAATESGVDKTKINEEITQLKNQLRSIAGSASFNGENWLQYGANDDPPQIGDAELVGSFVRGSNGAISVQTVTYDRINLAPGPGMRRGSALIDDSSLTHGQFGILTSDVYAYNAGAPVGYLLIKGAGSGTKYSSAPVLAQVEIGLTATTTNKDIKDMINVVEAMLQDMAGAAASMGSVSKRLDIQGDFVSNLRDSVQSGIGRLVDADMEEESSRLSALQTQQQLGVQALSIANSSSQSLLSLFR
jgi:flagellin